MGAQSSAWLDAEKQARGQRAEDRENNRELERQKADEKGNHFFTADLRVSIRIFF